MSMEIQFALTKDLRPDPEQPRKTFPPDADFDESTKQNGIVEPLAVRADPAGKTKWLIVEGERRHRRALELKIERVPIVVRDFRDEKDLRNYQRIMGTQRQNLSDLDRAADLDRELKRRQKENPKFSKTDLGAVLGIPRATIYEYLSLLALPALPLAALKSGELNHSEAVRLAIIPNPDDQLDLFQKLKEMAKQGYSLSVRELEEKIAEDYCVSLKGAALKTDQTYAVTGAQRVAANHRLNLTPDGASLAPCVSCPHRSGNLPHFPDQKNPNLCLLPACFRLKVLADLHRRGQGTIEPEKYARDKSQYVNVKDFANWGSMGYCETGKALGTAKAAPPKLTTVTAQGEVVEVFERAAVKAVLEKNGVKFKPSVNREQKKRAEAELKQKLLRERREQICADALPQLAKALPGLKDAPAWKLVNALSAAHWHQYGKYAVKVAKGDRETVLARCFRVSTPVTWSGRWNKTDVAAWRAAGVDLLKIEANKLKLKNTKSK